MRVGAAGSVRVALSAALIGCSATTAVADMGLAPAGPGEIYAGVEGGYLYQDGEDVIGYAIAVAPADPRNATVSADSGWFAGGLFGYEKGSPLLSGLPFTRAEVEFWYGRAEDDAYELSIGGVQLESVDADVLVTGGDTGRSSTERQTFAGEIKLEHDETWNSATTLTRVLSLYLRNNSEDAATVIEECCQLFRKADVDTWIVGIGYAVEPELAIAPGISLVGRLGASVYAYDAEADFRSYATGIAAPPGFFGASASDDETGVGFRGQLGAGVKFKILPSARLEAFADAEYFSDVGSARFSDNDAPANTIDPSGVETEDLWELRAGARLTIGLGR